MFSFNKSFLIFNPLEQFEINTPIWYFSNFFSNITKITADINQFNYFYFFFIYLHILKALLFKPYYKQNTVLWFSVIIIFFLSAGTAFLGKVKLLAATIITKIISYTYCHKNDFFLDSSRNWKIS